jgi:hypothetical protein
MQCPHGLGLGHMIVDLLMMVPFIGAFIIGVKLKLKKSKITGKENE